MTYLSRKELIWFSKTQENNCNLNIIIWVNKDELQVKQVKTRNIMVAKDYYSTILLYYSTIIL